MNRRLLFVAVLVLVGGGVAVLYVEGYLGRIPRTRIGLRTPYTGATTQAVAAEDWPAWRGPRGDQVSRERVGDAFPQGGPKRLWAADVGLGYSSPVAAGGRVYLFSLDDRKESLTAFDANSGEIRWSVAGGGGWTANFAGTRATPAIDGDRIYTYGGQGDLTCRNLADGAQRWQVNAPKEAGATGSPQWGNASSPLVAGNFVYVQAGTGGSIAVAVDKGTGKLAWKSEATGVGSYASPVIADVGGTPQLIVFGGQDVYGMDAATGRTVWQYPWRTNYDVNASTPIVRDGKLFVTSEYNHGCALLQLSRGAPPTKIWETDAIQGKFQGATLDGDHLYANSSGTIVCVAWADGALKWKAADPKLKLGAGGSLIRAKDKLVAMSERGKLSLIRATPEGAELLAQADEVVEGKEVWSTPVLYGGRLYAKGGQEFVCLEMTQAK